MKKIMPHILEVEGWGQRRVPFGKDDAKISLRLKETKCWGRCLWRKRPCPIWRQQDLGGETFSRDSQHHPRSLMSQTWYKSHRTEATATRPMDVSTFDSDPMIGDGWFKGHVRYLVLCHPPGPWAPLENGEEVGERTHDPWDYLTICPERWPPASDQISTKTVKGIKTALQSCSAISRSSLRHYLYNAIYFMLN